MGSTDGSKTVEAIALTAIDKSALTHRASSMLSASPRPFLRWAGSKRRLLPSIVPFLPQTYRRYYEPFLGGGSLFFLLRPRAANLADRCGDLIDTYKALRDNPSAVIRFLKPLRPDEDSYYAIRDAPSSGRFKRAAQFIYLNKTCWNGLYRVNKSGRFNVPYGRPRSDHIADTENLANCSAALSGPDISIDPGDFGTTVKNAGKDDLVFFDPPYVTGHSNNGFVDYNEVLFSWADQERLAMVADRLRKRGAHVVVTNGDHQRVRALYPHFEHHILATHSTISGKMKTRGAATELLLVGRR